MNKTNYFGDEIPEIKDILKDEAIRRFILNGFDYSMESGNSGIQDRKTVEQILRLAEDCESPEEYEANANRLIGRNGNANVLAERAEKIKRQITPYLAGNSAIDIGCGDGRVSELLHDDGIEVVLTDVYEHPYVRELRLKGYNFAGIRQEDSIPIDENKKQFDNAMILTVLHHSDNPEATLRDAARLVKKNGKVLIIESVYGIEYGVAESLEGEMDSRAEILTGHFKKLSGEQQRRANIFFDHFYNRIVHYSRNEKDKVNCPFNFNTPQGWNAVFERNGLIQVHSANLGIDQSTVPEYHTLHVLKKN